MNEKLVQMDGNSGPAIGGPVQRQARPNETRWYCVSREGMATLCRDEATAQAEAQKQQDEYPRSGPYIALQLVDAAEIDRLRETLKLQQTSYEREIALDVAAERERCAKLCEGMHAEDGPHAYAWAIRTDWASDSDGPNVRGKLEPTHAEP